METNQRIQQVIFIRHGIALHNVFDPQSTGVNRHDVFDPPLTTEGRIHSVLFGETIRGWIRKQQQHQRDATVQSLPRLMVITSPLTRCLQTAMYAFGIPSEYPSNTTFHCQDSLREACGIHRCDRRRTKSELQECWTWNNFGVQFSPTMTEHDELWSSTHRETIADLQSRIHEFLSFLVKLNEPIASAMTDSNICTIDKVVFIIVTHGVWIETLLRMYQAPYHLLYEVTSNSTGATTTTPPSTVPKRVHNGDAYFCECISSLSPSNDQPQLQWIQNFRQICGVTAVPPP